MNQSFIEYTNLEQIITRKVGIGNNITFNHLAKVFGPHLVEEAFKEFSVLTVPEYGGSSVFLYGTMDTLFGARLVETNPETGRPYEEEHKQKWISNGNLNPLEGGYFGARQLNKKPEAPVIVVEDEISAMVGSITYPDLVWLSPASGYHNMHAGLDACQGRDICFVATNENQAETLCETLDNTDAEVLLLEKNIIRAMDPSRHRYLADLILDWETRGETLMMVSPPFFDFMFGKL